VPPLVPCSYPTGVFRASLGAPPWMVCYTQACRGEYPPNLSLGCKRRGKSPDHAGGRPEIQPEPGL
jgi:hypothetical protein